MSLLSQIVEKRQAAQADLDALLKVAEDESRDLTDTEASDFDAKVSEIRAFDARIAELTEAEERKAKAAEVAAKVTATAPAVVTKEPRTYSAHAEVSFFADAFRGQHMGDTAAADRLARHTREVQVERESRATSTGSFGGLIVPQYLVNQAALVLRNGRPLANACTRLPLPDQGTTFQIPRGTTGASAAIQSSENSSVSSTDEVWTNVTLPVATIAGQQDVSRQSLERGTPGLDALIYMDLAGAYAAAVDSQVISGTGSSGQVLGILNTSGINTATAFGAAVTAANFTSKVAGGVQAVASSGTAIQPRVIVMHPRRWGWLQAQSDSSGRPLAVAMPVTPFNAAAAITYPGGYSADGAAIGDGGPQYVGMLANGLPVITDANIPTNVGTNSEDVVLVLDTQQMLLWENGDGMPQQLRFEQTLGNQLTVKLVVYNYAAFTAGRYPTAAARIGGADSSAGNGLIAPTF